MLHYKLDGWSDGYWMRVSRIFISVPHILFKSWHQHWRWNYRETGPTRPATGTHKQHCGTLQKCFAPKILGKAACWHVAPYGHIMTYYGEKNSKKANLWATRPPEASKLKYRIRDLFEPFPWLKALIKVLNRLCCSIYIIYFVSGCFWGSFWVIQGSF